MDFRLTTVTLGVDDLERAAAFYEQGLGLKPSAASEGPIRFYQCGPSGSAVLALYPRQALMEDACLEGVAVRAAFDGVTMACNCGSPAEVDALLARAQAAGATIAKPGQQAFWGGYSGYFVDPDGHLWEAVHVPQFALDERGGVVLP